MKRIILYTFLCFTCIRAAAQDTAGVAQEFPKEIAKKFAVARMIDFEFMSLSSRNVQSSLLRQDLGKREISSNRGLRASINLPVLKGNQWRLTYSMLYNYQGLKLSALNSDNRAEDVDLTYISSTGSFTYFSTFLNKRMIYNGSLIIDGSQKNFERIKPMASAVMILKSDKTTTMSVGLLAFYDPSSQTPVIPLFTYTRNFENGWRLDFILPQRILLQTRLLQNGRFSVGSQLNAIDFYMRRDDIVNFANKFEFRQTELRSGIAYEYLINKSIVLSARAGLMNVLNSKLTERGGSFSNEDYLMKFKSGTSGYFNLGISFNPF